MGLLDRGNVLVFDSGGGASEVFVQKQLEKSMDGIQIMF